MKPPIWFVVIGLFLSICPVLPAATLKVDGNSFRNVREAYAVASDGDVIEVEANLFLSECAGGFHPPKRVTILPVGGTATIHSAACDLSNDSFSNPEFLSGTNTLVNGSNSGASLEGCEDRILNCVGCGSGQSVWWSWTAPADGLAQITSQEFGVNEGRIAGVFTGTSVCDLNIVKAATLDPPSNDTPLDPLFFDARSNTTYHIAFDTTSRSRQISFGLTLDIRPPNDEIVNATELYGDWATVAGSTLAATTNASDPAPFTSAAGKTAWWKWIAPPSPRSGRPAIVSTAGSRFDTLLAVYEQTSGELILRGSNDDHQTEKCTDPDRATTLTSQVHFFPTAGMTYYFLVDGSKARKGLLDFEKKLLMQYAGAVQLTLDYSTLNITDVCHLSTGLCSTTITNALLSGSLNLAHFGDSPTHALRVSFQVANGYNKAGGFAPTDSTRVPTNSYLFPAGSLTAGNSLSLNYSNVSYPCPDADVFQSGGSDARKGWGVFAILEEDFDGAWIPVDSTLIAYGPWPRVPPFGGPNGGVIRSDPTNPPPNRLTDIRITGPLTVCESQSAIVVGEAVFDRGYSNAQPDWSWKGPLILSTNGLDKSALLVASNLSHSATGIISATLLFSGKTIKNTVDLNVHLLNDCSTFHAIRRLSTNVVLNFVDMPGKRVAIDYADELTPPVAWLPFRTNLVPTVGSLVLTNSVPANISNRFYRAREVP